MKIGIKYYPQHTNYSCAPVSLRMVFEHLGRHYSEEKMIELFHSLPKKGTNHKHIIQEVRNEGFKYIEKENGSVKDIINFLDNGYPVIINYYNPLSKRGHYSVIVGYEKKEEILILADPANGNDYTLNWKEFESLWHDESNSSKGWYLVIAREKLIL